MRRYWLCGWRVASDAELPELRHRDDEFSAEVSIRFGEVPDTLEDAVLRTPFCSVSKEGRALITVAAVGRFLVCDGTEITIQSAKGAVASSIRLFLWDMAFGLLCHQRGLFPLHAACVELEGAAVVLAGAAARGKSTLAGALAARGHQILADNVCVVDTFAPGGPAVIPAFSFVNLWPDSIENATAAWPDFAGVQTECMRPGLTKFQVRMGEPPPVGGAVPLRVVLGLGVDSMAVEPRLEPMRGFAAMKLIASRASLRRAAQAMGIEDRMFRGPASIAAGSLVGRLVLSHRFPDLTRLAIFAESIVHQASFAA